MQYTKPQLHSFGSDLKHGVDCAPAGSINKPACSSGGENTESATCNYGGEACTCSADGNNPASSCSNTGFSYKSSHH